MMVLLLHPPVASHPCLQQVGPCRGSGEILREDDAVRAVLEQMHLGGDVMIYACLVEGEAVLYGDDAVVGSGEEEDCGGVAGDVEFA